MVLEPQSLVAVKVRFLHSKCYKQKQVQQTGRSPLQRNHSSQVKRIMRWQKKLATSATFSIKIPWHPIDAFHDSFMIYATDDNFSMVRRFPAGLSLMSSMSSMCKCVKCLNLKHLISDVTSEKPPPPSPEFDPNKSC